MGFDLFPGDWESGGFIGSLSRKLGLQENPVNKAPITPLRRGTSPFNPNVLARLAQGARPRPPQGPSTADILRRLAELQDPSRYLGDSSFLDQQARLQAEQQYGPLIAELRNQMGQAQSRAGRNKVEIGQMFNSLSNNLQQDIPEIQQQFDRTEAETAGQYDRLKSNISGQYDQSLKDQEAMLQRLNIQAAAPEATKEQFRDKDYFTNLASVEGQTAQTALGQEERGATEFTRRGSEIARVEGTQRQADLMTQLSELLATYESQIGAYNVAKEQAYTSNLSGLQQSAQQQAQQQAQREFENYIKSIQLGRDLRKDELAGLGSTDPVASPADIPGRALSLGLSQASAQNLQNVFMTALSSDPTILAGIDSKYGVALPKEALAQRVVESGRNSGLSQQELNALQALALEYFGRR